MFVWKRFLSWLPTCQGRLGMPSCLHSLDWVGEGTYGSTTSLRRLCGLEMLVVYFSLAFVPFAVWRRRENLVLWATLLYAGAVLVALGVIVSNWGTLYDFGTAI